MTRLKSSVKRALSLGDSSSDILEKEVEKQMSSIEQKFAMRVSRPSSVVLRRALPWPGESGQMPPTIIIPEERWMEEARPGFKPIAKPIEGSTFGGLIKGPRYGWTVGAQEVYLRERPYLKPKYSLDF